MPEGFDRAPLSAEQKLAHRHFRERPLAKLTEHELDVLEHLSKSSLFNEHVSAALDDLGELAVREQADRDMLQAAGGRLGVTLPRPEPG